MSAILATLRVLAGSGCALAGVVGILYGLGVGAIWLFASLHGGPGVRAEDEGVIRSSWMGLAFGLPLVWGGYLLLTSHDDMARSLQLVRRRIMLDVARALDSTRDVPPATRGQGRMFTWQAWMGRCAALWFAVWLAGFKLRFWPGDGDGLVLSAKMSFLFCLAAGGFIIVHEFGHFCGACLARTRCTALHVGTGPRLFHGCWGKVKLDFHAWPWSGFVLVEYLTENRFRWRYAVVSASGPLLHGLALAAVVWIALQAEATLAPVIAALALPGIWLLVAGSLVPFRAQQYNADAPGVVFLDSAALLNAWRLPEVYVRWLVGLALSGEARKLAFSTQPNEQSEGGEQLAALLARYPGHTLLRFIAAMAAMHRKAWAEAADLLERRSIMQTAIDPVPSTLLDRICTERLVALTMSGDSANARAECLESLESDEIDAAKANRLDRLACLPLMQGLHGYWHEALDWVARARVFYPEGISIQGTQGSLLVEVGRLEEGKSILDHVLAVTDSEHDRGICALYLAIAAHQQGRREEAELLAAEALRLCPKMDWLRIRWERELLGGRSSQPLGASTYPAEAKRNHHPSAIQ